MNAPVTQRRFPWRRWLFVLVSIALIAVVATQFTSIEALGDVLSTADWGWAAIALALQAAFFLLYGGLYQAGFQAVGVSSRAVSLVPVLLASIFAKTAVPFTAAPAAAVFIDDATTRGESGPRTAVGVVVVLAVDLLTALPFVFAGAIALLIRNRLVEFGLVGTALFVAFTAAVLISLVLAARSPGLLRGLLAACRAVVNRLASLVRRPALLSDGWAAQTTAQLGAAVISIPGRPREIAIASGYGLLLHFANIAGLGALFLAFGQDLDLASLAAGFGMSIVFFIIAIVPDGIGAVEGAMALVFVQLGMAAAPAILVTVAYRVLNVWLPVAIGFWYARRLRLFGGGEAARQGTRVIEPEPRWVVPETKER
jgi:uncharacterized protein (TIRG00374 family)